MQMWFNVLSKQKILKGIYTIYPSHMSSTVTNWFKNDFTIFHFFTLVRHYALWSLFQMSKNPILYCYNASMIFLKLSMQIKENYPYFRLFLFLFSFGLLQTPLPSKKVTAFFMDGPIANWITKWFHTLQRE